MVLMSKDMAMKTLGLTGIQGQNKGKAKTLNDYSEEEINTAFQTECKNLSKFQLASFGLLQPQIETAANNRGPQPQIERGKDFRWNKNLICFSQDREVRGTSNLSRSLSSSAESDQS